jgi:endogenous inhibitor of DNA gyrase (YacG/DUF329 family)
MKVGDEKSKEGIQYVFGKCLRCGKEKWMFKSSFLMYCSRKCMGLDQRFEKSPNWKGGTYVHKGYLRFSRNDLKRKLVHRHIMEIHLGRNLEKNERIHHINGIKTDNRIENLVVCKNNAEHIKSFHPAQ